MSIEVKILIFAKDVQMSRLSRLTTRMLKPGMLKTKMLNPKTLKTRNVEIPYR